MKTASHHKRKTLVEGLNKSIQTYKRASSKTILWAASSFS